MSTILNALRKLERDRQRREASRELRRQVSSGPGEPPPSPRRGRFWLALFLGLLVGGAAVAGGWVAGLRYLIARDHATDHGPGLEPAPAAAARMGSARTERTRSLSRRLPAGGRTAESLRALAESRLKAARTAAPVSPPPARDARPPVSLAPAPGAEDAPAGTAPALRSAVVASGTSASERAPARPVPATRPTSADAPVPPPQDRTRDPAAAETAAQPEPVPATKPPAAQPEEAAAPAEDATREADKPTPVPGVTRPAPASKPAHERAPPEVPSRRPDVAAPVPPPKPEVRVMSEKSPSPVVVPSPEALSTVRFPEVLVSSVRWHPDAHRRVARLEVDRAGPLEVREGDIVAGVLVETIRPAAVELRVGGKTRVVSVRP